MKIFYPTTWESGATLGFQVTIRIRKFREVVYLHVQNVTLRSDWIYEYIKLFNRKLFCFIRNNLILSFLCSSTARAASLATRPIQLISFFDGNPEQLRNIRNMRICFLRNFLNGYMLLFVLFLCIIFAG